MNPSLEFVIMLVLVWEGDWIWKPWAEGSLDERVTVWTLPNTISCAPWAVRPKKPETSEFGAKKDLLQGHSRRWVAHAPSSQTWTPQRVSAKHFKGQVREGGDRLRDQLVHSSLIGWCWSNGVVNFISPCVSVDLHAMFSWSPIS